MCCIIPSSLGKYRRSSSRIKRNFWRRCRGDIINIYLVPDHKSHLLAIYIICHFPLIFISPTSQKFPVLFALFFVRHFFVRSIFFACDPVAMASMTTPPLSPDFEVLYFKQRQGQNLKDAWYRLMESYRICNLKGDAKVLLLNFYIGLTLHHRQLLNFAAKGNFIELDANAAYEILDGILGVPP